MVFLIYGSAAVLALAFLWFFHARWYWHAASVTVALVVGFLPPSFVPVPAAWGMARDLTVGFVFVFLVIWGLGAPFFVKHHQARHAAHHA